MSNEARLKGVGVVHLAECIQQSYGEEGWRLVLASVSPGTRRMLEAPLAWEWYPLRQVVETECCAIDRFHDGDFTQGFRFGEYRLEKSIHKVYKVLFLLLETTFLVKKSAQLWRTFVDTGKLEVEQLAPDRALLRVSGIDPIHLVYCHDLRGSFYASLTACGARNLQIIHTECVLQGAPACLFEAKW